MRNQQEHIEQRELFYKLSLVPWQGGFLSEFFYAVPNAGTTGGRRGAIAGSRRRAEGVKSGVPDVECPISAGGFSGLHIELKRLDGVPSDVSPSQKRWIERLRKCGRRAEVAYGCEEAWKIICDYLGIKT